MKQIVASKVVDIPSDVTFEVKARKVRVKGARGERRRSVLQLGLNCTALTSFLEPSACLGFASSGRLHDGLVLDVFSSTCTASLCGPHIAHSAYGQS